MTEVVAAATRTTAARWLRRHWLFAVLLAGGIAIRVVVLLAYQPALFFFDSTRYLEKLDNPDPGDTSPLGYTFMLLWPVLKTTGQLVAVPIAHHLIGLLIAVGAYRLLLRWGVWRWLAAVATVPVLFDAYQLQIEQMIMSDTLFEALLLLALLLLGRRRPGHVVAALTGVVLAAAVLTRLLGYPCFVVAICYLLVAGADWRRRLTTSAVALVAFAVPLLGYMTYFESKYPGEYRITRADAMSAYARVAPIADCRGLEMPDYQRVLCDPRPPEERPGPEYYHWDPDRPAKQLDPPPGVSFTRAITDFTWRIVRHQPVDTAQAVLYDFFRGFWWAKETEDGEPAVERWEFTREKYEHSYDVTKYTERWGGIERAVDTQLAGFLVGYQKYVFLRGTLMGACLLLAIGGALGLGRARRSGMRAVTALAAALPGSTLVLAAAVEFSWRYQLPGIVLLPVAGALGVVAMFRRTERQVVDTVTAPAEDGTDAQALREFAERYADARFAPVVVIIAAYNEETGIGPVVDSIPSESCGLAVETLVVDDGSPDATADLAREHGAYVCRPPRNRGQGAALRLGYQLARERGAQYIVTTDADGQYDIDEMPLLLQPLVDGTADFVTGSRVLGSHQATDVARRVGTPFFAWLVSALTGTRVTDTSFGFRAMRAEVTGEVNLSQPQYQSSELLIGVLARGYRVLEQPMSMLKRNQGTTKKGNAVVYGYRYASVVLGTWWRERGARGGGTSAAKRALNTTP